MPKSGVMPNTPTHLTSEQVCDRLHIHRSTLSRWVAAGRITPAMKLPGVRGAFLFAEDEVARTERGVAA